MLRSSKRRAEKRLNFTAIGHEFHNFAADDMEAPLGRGSPAALTNAGRPPAGAKD
jgi:hypothetical protein